MVLANDFNPRKVGAVLLGLIFVFALSQAYWTGATAAPGLFTEESRSGMLAMLFLAGLSAAEIFTAKLAGVLVLGATRILGIVPCLFVPIIMMRLPWEVFPIVLAVLAVWLLLSVSTHSLASAMFEDESSARLVADFSLAGLALLTPAINSANRLFGGAPIDWHWLALSPAYGPWLLITQPGSAAWTRVLVSAGWSALFSFLFFAGAAFILKRSWKAQTVGPTAGPAWLQPFLQWLRNRQRRRAANLLEISPYAWLVARDFRPVLAAWIALGIVLGAWTIGLWNWSRFWLLPLNFWITCVFLSEVVRFLVHYLAAKQIGYDRVSGGLEILLTTSLSLEEMLGGIEEVVRRYIRPLNIVVGMVMAAFFAAGFWARSWTSGALATYLIIWTLVAVFGPWTGRGFWVGFWVSLHTGRPGYALRRRLLQYTGFISAAFQLYINFNKLIKFPYGTSTELWVVGVVGAAFAVALPFGFRQDRKQRRALRQMIFEDLRAVAAEPPPSPDDPRLKKWNPSEPLYRRPAEKILV